MTATLHGVDEKLKRAVAHINNLSHQVSAFRDLEPYSVRVQQDIDHATGKTVGRLVTIKNPNVDATPGIGLVLLAGEAIYQMRSALDHLVHQLVILNGQAAKLAGSRRHQFPIFETPQGYRNRAPGMIDGVSQTVANIIELEQPYSRTASGPTEDALWILQDLNNTDKHRLIPVSVLGIGEIRGHDSRGQLFSLTSPDIVLEDNKVIWSFTTPNGRYDDVYAELSCAIAFEQAMSMYGQTTSLDSMLLNIVRRIHRVVAAFRFLFPQGKGIPSP